MIAVELCVSVGVLSNLTNAKLFEVEPNEVIVVEPVRLMNRVEVVPRLVVAAAAIVVATSSNQNGALSRMLLYCVRVSPAEMSPVVLSAKTELTLVESVERETAVIVVYS